MCRSPVCCSRRLIGRPSVDPYELVPFRVTLIEVKHLLVSVRRGDGAATRAGDRRTTIGQDVDVGTAGGVDVRPAAVWTLPAVEVGIA